MIHLTLRPSAVQEAADTTEYLDGLPSPDRRAV